MTEPCPAESSKRFLLPTSCSNEFFDGGDYFVVEISPEYARLLLKRVALLRSALKEDPEAYELYFWDYAGDYYGGLAEDHDPRQEPAAMECNQLIVREQDICWTAIPKHTDFWVTSEPILVSDLEKIAAAGT